MIRVDTDCLYNNFFFCFLTFFFLFLFIVRSVIRSRVKLSYEHAQDFIDNPEKDFATNEVPEISDNVAVSTIQEKVRHYKLNMNKFMVIGFAIELNSIEAEGYSCQ